MNTRPIHENLNTAFVDLSALMEHLRARKFAGKIHLETKNYEADIFLTADNRLNFRENDHLAGRVSAGDDVLTAILDRAREPDGLISVFPELPKTLKKRVPGRPEFAGPIPPAPEVQTTPIPKLFAEPLYEFAEAAPQPPAYRGPEQESKKPRIVSLKEKLGLSSLPFSFTNRFEKKARKLRSVPVEDWHELLELTSEMLSTVENCLTAEKLNFLWIFDKVRVDILEDYPFLQPDSAVFKYQDGRVSMSEQVNKHVFTASILESIRQILGKLDAHPKFDEVCGMITDDLRKLQNNRREQFDKFAITQPLRQIIGI